MPGRTGKGVLGLACVLAFACSGVATAATQSVVATKSRSISVAPANPGATAAKKKKKKKRGTATTQSAQAAFASGTAPAATANCTPNTHASGGGFAVTPSFTPPATGLRTVDVSSNPLGTAGWSATSAAFVSPAATGSLTTFVRCESNSLGKLAATGSSSVTLAPGVGQNLVFNCAPGSHVIAGGFAGTPPGNFTNINTWYSTVVLQNRRTGPGQWTVTGYNNPDAGASATLTGYAVCEVNAKGRSISEAAAVTPLGENARGAVDATCTGRTHVISGGFLINPVGPGTVPGVGVDEMQPVGSKGWHVGLHDFVDATLPAGSTLTGYAYCAPDAAAKKTKKKK